MNIEFWAPALGLVAILAVLMARALRGAPDTGPQAADGLGDVAVYRAQLDEVARDVARGTLAPEEADRLRAEVARRLIAADRATVPTATAPARAPVAALALSGLMLALGVGLYLWLGAPGYPDLPLAERLARADAAYRDRPSQSVAEEAARQPDNLPQDEAGRALVLRLRETVAARPDDLEGHRLLARTEASFGNYAAAAAAAARVVALRGTDATAADHADLAELMIFAAGGAVVTPQAEAELTAALALDPANGKARYYGGLMMALLGRPDRAFDLWRPLVEDSTPADPWHAALRAQIEGVAAAAGVDYALPEAPPSPDAADVAAAGGMSAEERQEMIAGMVAGLEERLMTSGGSVEEWARLVTALGVLGEATRRQAALAAARAALAQDPEGLAAVEAAASGAAP